MPSLGACSAQTRTPRTSCGACRGSPTSTWRPWAACWTTTSAIPSTPGGPHCSTSCPPGLTGPRPPGCHCCRRPRPSSWQPQNPWAPKARTGDGPTLGRLCGDVSVPFGNDTDSLSDTCFVHYGGYPAARREGSSQLAEPALLCMWGGDSGWPPVDTLWSASCFPRYCIQHQTSWDGESSWCLLCIPAGDVLKLFLTLLWKVHGKCWTRTDSARPGDVHPLVNCWCFSGRLDSVLWCQRLRWTPVGSWFPDIWY